MIRNLTAVFVAIFISIYSLNAGPIHTASKFGDLTSIKKLIDSGVDINALDNHTPLQIVVKEYVWSSHNDGTASKYLECMNYLLDNGANPNISRYISDLPLCVALGNINVVNVLISHGAKIDLKIETYDEFHDEFSYEYFSALYNLIFSHNSPFRPYKKISTSRSSWEMAEYLINNDADIFGYNGSGEWSKKNWNPLFQLAQNIPGRFAASSTSGLTDKDINYMRHVQTELINKLINNNYDLYKEIKIGVNSSAFNSNEMSVTFLHTAPLYVLKSLSTPDKMDFDYKSKGGYTPLMFRINKSLDWGDKMFSVTKLDYIKYYVENGANINASDDNGNTVFHYAVYRGDKDLVEYLLRKKVSYDKLNSLNKMPIDYAQKSEIYELINKKTWLEPDEGESGNSEPQIRITKITPNKISINGETKKDSIIERSADLKNWNKLEEVNKGGFEVFVDPAEKNKEFFRVKSE